MKTILLLATLALAAVSSALAQNTTNESPATILSADSDVSVARGMSREAVSLMLGVPNETLGDNVWIYADFKGKGAPDAAKFDTLLVRFADNQVVSLRLAQRQPVADLVAKHKAKTVGTTQVAVAKK